MGVPSKPTAVAVYILYTYSHRTGPALRVVPVPLAEAANAVYVGMKGSLKDAKTRTPTSCEMSYVVGVRVALLSWNTDPFYRKERSNSVSSSTLSAKPGGGGQEVKHIL